MNIKNADGSFVEYIPVEYPKMVYKGKKGKGKIVQNEAEEKKYLDKKEKKG